MKHFVQLLFADSPESVDRCSPQQHIKTGGTDGGGIVYSTPEYCIRALDFRTLCVHEAPGDPDKVDSA